MNQKIIRLMLSQYSNYKKNIIASLIFALALIAWLTPVPTGLADNAWHLLIIFITTIIFLILNPFPMGATALMSILACTLTKTLSIEQCLSGFGNSIVWLVVFAFFISHGFIKTGLGSRIAYYIIFHLGSSTLGLSYALVFIDLILAPFMPSASARGGGIIFPIAKSICQSYANDSTHSNHVLRNSGFLMKVCFQSNVITSSMFITAMAANPLAVKLAADGGVAISWLDWAKASIIPGIVILIIMPILLYYLYPPAIKHSDSAPKIAKENLEKMGRISAQEIVMLGIFAVLIFFWIFGEKIGLSATLVALGGLCGIYLFRIISLEENLSDKNTWHTFLWFSTLVMISGFLAQFGLIGWVKNQLNFVLDGFSPMTTIVILSLMYFYIHYFFASTTTHIAVLFPTFLVMFTSSGVPILLSALILSFFSSLSSGLTQFGLSSAPIFFGTGYMQTKVWWLLGFILSIMYIIIYATIGAAWWKLLGLW